MPNAPPQSIRAAASLRWRRSVALVLVMLLGVATGRVSAQTQTIRVDLKLVTGGALTGIVVDHTSHGLVVVSAKTPYVFAWDEVEAGSAFAVKRDLLTQERGGAEHLTAEDHYQLGLFALARNRTSLAATMFRKAGDLNSAYRQRARGAVVKHQAQGSGDAHTRDREEQRENLISRLAPPDGLSSAAMGLSKRVGDVLEESTAPRIPAAISASARDRVMEIYRSFGQQVREVMARNLALVETEHFLIWTDWNKADRVRLGPLCESMYGALRARFGIDADRDVFLAKCPIFCWKSKMRFRRFAQQFDGVAGTNSIGYTRSIERNGHVHVVLLRQGRSDADYDRFACTLVHEGSHAFLHRLYSTRLIPHWVNEGLAELIAARVLGDRCPNAANAALLARQYVRFDWPVGALLAGTGPIGVHQYPLAHSVVAHLESLDAARFAAFVRGLKEGRTVPESLETHYDGMTLDQLEAGWRSALRAADSAAAG